MFLSPTSHAFNHMDHRLFAAHPKGRDLANAKTFRSNRRTIQAYLYRIQKRFERGSFKGAIALFDFMVARFNMARWVAIAASDEIKLSPEVRAKYLKWLAQQKNINFV